MTSFQFHITFYLCILKWVVNFHKMNTSAKHSRKLMLSLDNEVFSCFDFETVDTKFMTLC